VLLLGKKPKRKTQRDKLIEYLKDNKNTCTDDIYLIDEYIKENNLDPKKVLDDAEEYIIKILTKRRRKQIRITLFENPNHTGRPRLMGRIIHVFGAKESKERFRNRVKSVIYDVRQLINTTINIRIEFYMAMPKGLKPKEVIAHQCNILEPATKPDHDNMDKFYCDMMNNTIYLDDDLICRAELIKFYNLRPRVVITLKYLTKHESEYVYKKIRNRKIIKELRKEGYVNIELL